MILILYTSKPVASKVSGSCECAPCHPKLCLPLLAEVSGVAVPIPAFHAFTPNISQTKNIIQK